MTQKMTQKMTQIRPIRGTKGSGWMTGNNLATHKVQWSNKNFGNVPKGQGVEQDWGLIAHLSILDNQENANIQ